MLILMLLMEGIVLCFILLMFCVIGIANGPEKFTVFYEKNVQEKAIKLGYTTQNIKSIKHNTIPSIRINIKINSLSNSNLSIQSSINPVFSRLLEDFIKTL